MKTAPVPLPLTSGNRLFESDVPGPIGLPRVEFIERKGPVLHSSPLVDQDDVLSLNLGVGCGHRCGFCSARAYPNFPGDEVVRLYRDTAAELSADLTGRSRLPRAVYVSPSTDPFPPLAEFQTEAAQVVEVLARHGVETWLMTRGFIRPVVMEVLAAHREHVKVTIGLTTLDRNLQRILEPLAASPRLRLRQIRRLRDLGIQIQVAIEPLLPGLTDTRENLAGLLQALADAGVTRVTAGYMFLRPRIQDNLSAALKPHGWDRLVLDCFTGGPVLQTESIAPARYLSKARRQRGYAVLMALASELGITVGVSGVTNPDFRAPMKSEPRSKQRLLPQFEDGARLLATLP
jgi:DNA repair photolyase